MSLLAWSAFAASLQVMSKPPPGFAPARHSVLSGMAAADPPSAMAIAPPSKRDENPKFMHILPVLLHRFRRTPAVRRDQKTKVGRQDNRATTRSILLISSHILLPPVRRSLLQTALASCHLPVLC